MKEKENILVISTKNAFSENLLKELEKREKEVSFIEKEELINNKRFDMLTFYKSCGGIIQFYELSLLQDFVILR